ncbi:MAG: hypothetical protein AAFN80_14835 [Pseudomonadota bacterium]
MRQLILLTLCLACLATPVWPETVSCEGSNVSVSASTSAYADMTCNAVEKARSLFKQCDFPLPKVPVLIEVVRELKDGCTAVYHCGLDWIEILEPPFMEARRGSGGAFSFLAIEEYFQSVVVHELAHVLYDDVPCPFTSCSATNEYLAYTIQIMSLTKEEQIAFAERSGLDRRISRDELSSIILMMAPDRFAQKAWAHASQQGDTCGFLWQILDGKVLLDYERF